MTITSHTRVQRGYYRAYYAEHADELRRKACERRKWRYRLGCALQLLEELREHWRSERESEARSMIRLTPPSLVTFKEWTTCATDGVNKPSTGRSTLRIRSIG